MSKKKAGKPGLGLFIQEAAAPETPIREMAHDWEPKPVDTFLPTERDIPADLVPVIPAKKPIALAEKMIQSTERHTKTVSLPHPPLSMPAKDDRIKAMFVPPNPNTEVCNIARHVLAALLPPAMWEAPPGVPPPSGRQDRLIRPFELCSAYDMLQLLRHCGKLMAAEPTLARVKTPVKIFGDIHGQLRDLLAFFSLYGSPHHRKGDIFFTNYLFLGDYVDRGEFSLEILVLLVAMKVLYPERVSLVRGNHEERTTNEKYGFLQECEERLAEEDWKVVYEEANAMFDLMPLAAVVDNSIFCCHGGIGKHVITLGQVDAIKRPISGSGKGSNPADFVVHDLLWSDPTDDRNLNVHASSHTDADSFGVDRLKEFCEFNNLDLVIRAHQVVPAGYRFFGDGQLLTLFSAPNYPKRVAGEGDFGNNGAMLIINTDHRIVPMIITGKNPELWPAPAKGNYWSDVPFSVPEEPKGQVAAAPGKGWEDSPQAPPSGGSAGGFGASGAW
eukprot:CAMPEP_0114555610 /NCGR_PEP_ID=MMETSP0114-20121206/8844_1 /TAXON_ID=31324 /ORGANISM="Goniomonas sp, Strain m" /LENGTH=499 /DNA_ID=CAMNT_0001740753 /DNA_START=8 /DNA_END=1507 /DNA_ORIENTATION=-